MRVHFRFFLSVASVAVLFTCQVARGDDDVVRYYWQQAWKAHEKSSERLAKTTYTATLTRVWQQLGRKGVIEASDTLVFRVKVIGDSIVPLDTTMEQLPKTLELTPPNIFEQDYQLTTYPNDTGGIDYAIGFETDLTEHDQPTGLAIIHRSSYVLRWLYLHYPDERGHTRFTRTFRFIDINGLVLPDSILEVGTRPGLVRDESYRIETSVYNISF